MDTSLLLLFGRARSLVLGTLHAAAVGTVSEPLHLREIARRTELSPTAVQYELRLLDQLGVVSNIGTPARPLYILDREHALYVPMHAMFSRQAIYAKDLSAGDRAHFKAKRARQLEDLGKRPEETSAFLAAGKKLRNSVSIR